MKIRSSGGPARAPFRGMRSGALLLFCVLLPAVSLARAQDGSLWDDELGTRYSNRKAMRVGDLITVLVTEASQGSNRATLKTAKESKVSFDGGPGQGALGFLPSFDLKSGVKDELNGTGQSTLSGSLRTKLTVQVVEIRPNGQLVVEGSRLLSVNGQDDRFTLHGVVRPEDVQADNTVLSTYLAEARITYDGKGAVKNAASRGIFLRILSWIF